MFYVYNGETTSTGGLVKLKYKGHCSGILILDQNRYTNIYAVGAGSGIKQISIGISGSDAPYLNDGAINIPIGSWSHYMFITFDRDIEEKK